MEYAELMNIITLMYVPSFDVRRALMNEHYLDGSAGVALEMDSLDSALSPFYDADAPEAVTKVISDFAKRKAEKVRSDKGKPEKKHKGDASFKVTTDKWLAGKESDKRWLTEHKDSKIVSGAVQEV